MKKTALTNIIIVCVFTLFDPLLNRLSELGDTYNLGTEMVLGLITPVLFCIFAFLALCLILVSTIECFAKKDLKQLMPIAIFVVGIVVYMIISDSDSFWVRLIYHYINV